ncbi:MAG: (2Fe-2S)-binding protein [Gemmatimonadota bacterium]
MTDHTQTGIPADPGDVGRSRISRRGFLKGMGGGVLGTAAVAGGLLGEEVAAAAAGPETVSGLTRIELQVNGQARAVEVEPRTTLLRALRDQLGLTGAKEGCNRGQCGACTVLLDGAPVLACSMLALDARSRQITTVEGLGAELTPVQEAFVEKDALMCGYCTPGMVMAATALLAANPNPTAAQIRAGVSGNACRCGTYPKVFEAVAAASEKMRQRGAGPTGRRS